ncbi:MAG: OmpA family protein [Flavobacteriia bacterium]|nr:OmpA family protein [Flavobacteriia bacterium]
MKSIFLYFYLLLTVSFFSQQNDSIYVFYFKFGENTQIEDSIKKFEKFIAPFYLCKTCGIKIEGYTDKIGSEKANQNLAAKRISFVRSLIKDTNQMKIAEVSIIGEKLSQNAKQNEQYRIVKLKVFSPYVPKKVITRIETEAKYEKFSELNKPIRLTVQFKAGKFNLLPESDADLILVAEFMKKTPNVKAKIVGHVCCSDERLLSKNRALSVYNYLIDKGINKNRLTYEGMSNRQPLVKEIDEYTESINRRVEIIFILED